MRAPRLGRRTSGLLLHPTSLPGPHGCGDLGPETGRFLSFLAAAGQRWWQTLPVGPAGYGNSPYSAHSAFAGNPLLISPEGLVAEGLLDAEAAAPSSPLPEGRVDYARAHAHREDRLRRAFLAFRGGRARSLRAPLDAFRARSASWLEDFALYSALKSAHGGSAWTAWEPPVRDREPAALERAREELAEEIDYVVFQQLLFDRQWQSFRDASEAAGVGLLGDVPIFVAHDSAEVWQARELFRLDEVGAPTVVAGVPPDYFSATGQLWGNPLYRWARMKKTGYAFWIARFKKTLERFHAVRIDHFIGFQRYWEIPAGASTAASGRWMKGPGAHFFEVLREALGELPLVAEDLGAVTPRVKALRDQFGLPGLRILQFAFGDDPSAPDFLPHNYPRGCVVYTGTHDNDTTLGWYLEKGGEGSTRSEAQTEIERRVTREYLGSDGREIHWDMIRMALLSVADTAIFPVQDLLGLGAEARMNRPGTAEGNWEWRLSPGALTEELAARLRGLTTTYGRRGSR